MKTKTLCRALLLLAALALGTAGCGQQPTAIVIPPTATGTKVKLATVERGELSAEVAIRGQIIARQEATLSFPIGGTIAAAHVSPGDRIEAGAVLFELNASELDEALDKASYAVEIAKLILQQAEANQKLDSARAYLSVALARRQASNAAAATQRGIADLQLSVSTANVALLEVYSDPNATDPSKQAAVGSVQSAEAAVRIAGQTTASADADQAAQVAVAQAKAVRVVNLQSYDLNLLKKQLEWAEAKYQLLATQAANTKLTAPFSGIVLSVRVQPGQQVEAFGPVAEVADPTVLQVEAAAFEKDVAGIAVGQAAQVELDAYPGTHYAGRVVQVAELPQLIQGERTYSVRVVFDEGQTVPAAIRMGANVTIVTGKRQNVLTLPTSAVRFEANTPTVWLWDEKAGTHQAVPVAIGLQTGDKIEIVSGLVEGQKVVLP